MRRIAAIICCAALFGSVCSGEQELSAKQLANRKTVEKLNAEWKKSFGEKESHLVLPALLADRPNKRITFLAESTDISVGDIVEFFVIGEASGHDYESLAVSFATAGSIKKALEFIGMEAGLPVNPKENRFWPKGERVKMRIALHSKPDELVPVEQYVLDDRTGKTLPEEGFAFTGSVMIENARKEKVLAADAREPQSIASNYNEPETLLDVPYQGNQDALYDHLHSHEGRRLPADELLQIVLEPEYKDGTRRICELTLEASAPEQATDSITNYIFSVTDTDDKILNSDKDLKSSLALFNVKNSADKDVYVTVRFDDNVPAIHASQICQVMQSLEASGSIRIEAPPKGQLYYRAFTPSPAYLDRKARAGHPWELRLRREKDAVTGKLTQCEFKWADDVASEPEIIASDYDSLSPEKLRSTIESINKDRTAADKQPNIPVMLTIVPTDMTFGEIMGFISPSMDIVPIVHIYAQDN